MNFSYIDGPEIFPYMCICSCLTNFCHVCSPTKIASETIKGLVGTGSIYNIIANKVVGSCAIKSFISQSSVDWYLHSTLQLSVLIDTWLTSWSIFGSHLVDTRSTSFLMFTPRCLWQKWIASGTQKMLWTNKCPLAQIKNTP